MKLNALICKNAKPRLKAYKISDGNGMYLEVHPSGARYWRLKYRINGVEKRISLGCYPQVSLMDARNNLIQEIALLREGIDPSQFRQDKKRLAAHHATQTFELVAREWHKTMTPRWGAEHAKDILSRLDRNVFPEIGRLPINRIAAPDVIVCLRKIEDRKAHDMAKRCLQMTGQILRYAVQTGRITTNFAPDLKGALVGHKSVPFAAITTDQLPGLIKSIEENRARLFRPTILAMKLMMLTFVRTQELIEATWGEFDFANKEWKIPAQRMKMRKEHIVPLSRQAVAILNELKGQSAGRKFIFPHVWDKNKSMSNGTILKGLKRLGYKGTMTGHGFRALAMSTIKEKLGYRHEVVDRQLAHAPKNSVDKAYDRASFLDERREMMQKWADYIDSITT